MLMVVKKDQNLKNLNISGGFLDVSWEVFWGVFWEIFWEVFWEVFWEIFWEVSWEVPWDPSPEMPKRVPEAPRPKMSIS